MLAAIEQAKLAKETGDYAIGAVIVKGGEVVVARCNRSKSEENPVNHAEALAIIEACKIFETRHPKDCILYTTHKPCPMCASLAVWAKLKGIIYGARVADMAEFRVNNQSDRYLWRTIDIPLEEVVNRSTEKIEIVRDFMREECIKLFHL